MTCERERAEFLVAMKAEGMPDSVARRILRHANTIQRCAALACSSEAADRDRVKCPGKGSGVGGPYACLCHDYGSFQYPTTDQPPQHGTVPRYIVQDQRAAQHIEALCAKILGITPVFSGDPRGACVKLKVPSGKTDDWGQTGICVPTREY